MGLFKELSLVIFLLLTTTFQVWGQSACTSHLMPNSTIDFDQYNNTGLSVIQSLTSSGQSGMADCSLRCCETENCSLVIFTEDENNNCLLIQCFSDEACKPMPSNTSQYIKSIRNNEILLASTLVSNDTSMADNSTAINSTDLADNATMNVPSVPPTTTATILLANASVPENGSVSENDTALSESLESNIALMNSSINATDLGSNDDIAFPTSIVPDNVTAESNVTTENTTGLFTSNSQDLEPLNVTSLNESLGTSDNSTGVNSSNDTTMLGEPVTETILHLPVANETSSSENGTVSVPKNSSIATDIPAIIIGANSTWLNSTNGTLPSFNGVDGDGSGNNTAAAEEADIPEGGGAFASNQSMMVILVATLSVGMLLFISIVAVVSKKAVDGWQRRHYSRIDYLVNGMYN